MAMNLVQLGSGWLGGVVGGAGGRRMGVGEARAKVERALRAATARRYFSYLDLTPDLVSTLEVAAEGRLRVVGQAEKDSALLPRHPREDALRGLLHSLNEASCALGLAGWRLGYIELGRSGDCVERIDLRGPLLRPAASARAWTWEFVHLQRPWRASDTPGLRILIVPHPLFHTEFRAAEPATRLWQTTNTSPIAAGIAELSDGLRSWASGASGASPGPLGLPNHWGLKRAWTPWFTGEARSCSVLMDRLRLQIDELSTPPSILQPIGAELASVPWEPAWRAGYPREPIGAYKGWLRKHNPTLLRVLYRLHLNGVIDLVQPVLPPVDDVAIQEQLATMSGPDKVDLHDLLAASFLRSEDEEHRARCGVLIATLFESLDTPSTRPNS